MKNHSQAGFTLIEVAIALIIIGILAGTALPSLLRYRQATLISQTRGKQETLLKTIAAYALAYGQLPCPADPDQKGLERTSCHNFTTSMGIIPYHSLGLPESAARDAFNRYMTYVVHPHSHVRFGSDTTTLSDICRISKGQHTLQLKDKYHQNLIPETIQHDFVAVILISHGPTGHGAYKGRGKTQIRTESAGNEEEINAKIGPIFYNLPFKLNDNPFRHIVTGVTRNNLMAQYGHKPCTAEQFAYISNPKKDCQDVFPVLE